MVLSRTTKTITPITASKIYGEKLNSLNKFEKKSAKTLKKLGISIEPASDTKPKPFFIK